MERKIGEVLTINGVTLEVVKCEGCTGCYFDECDSAYAPAKLIIGPCSDNRRSDNTSVIFKMVK